MVARLQARLACTDVYVAGEPHPKAHLTAAFGLHQGDLASSIGLLPDVDSSTFDRNKHARSYPADPGDSFMLHLPVTLQLDNGETITVRTISDFWR